MMAMVGVNESAGDRIRIIVAGRDLRPKQAIEFVRRLCRDELNERVDLKIIDIYEHQDRTLHYEIIVALTLVRLLPFAVRRTIEKLLAGKQVLHSLQPSVEAR
jgi:hypothetical protein